MKITRPKLRRLQGSNQYAARYVRYGKYSSGTPFRQTKKKTDPTRNMMIWFSIYGAFVAIVFLAKISMDNQNNQLHGAKNAYANDKIISPVPEDALIENKIKPEPTKAVLAEKTTSKIATKAKDYDIWVGEAVDTFYGDDRDKSSEVRMIMHCLLNRESHHSNTIAHGDGGQAGGALQFWEGTWTRMRSHMIEDGYATDMSDRYNMKDAIFTTVYAISQGWGKEWGPILRDYNGAGWATCPTPSWYE